MRKQKITMEAPITHCVNCGKEFEAPRKIEDRFCSRQCKAAMSSFVRDFAREEKVIPDVNIRHHGDWICINRPIRGFSLTENLGLGPDVLIRRDHLAA